MRKRSKENVWWIERDQRQRDGDETVISSKVRSIRKRSKVRNDDEKAIKGKGMVIKEKDMTIRKRSKAKI
jgi:hypothetical protein